jgi:tetratricopeptide (TPR) repeat protein
MFTIYLLIILIGLVLIGFGTYFAYQYLFPKKIEELAKMVEMGQTRLAIRGLTELLEKDERNPYVHFLLGEAFSQENNYPHSIVEYRQVLKLGRFGEQFTEVEVRSKLAHLFKGQKALDDAKKEYLILTKLEPRNFENFYQVALLFFNAAYFEKALQYFKKSVQLNPKHMNSHFYLGQIYYKYSKISEAKDAFTKTVNLDPKNFKAHYFIGLIMRQLNELDWAIKEFETAQVDNDIRVKAMLGKGLCLMDKSQFRQSQQEFEKALNFALKNSETEFNLRYFAAYCAERLRDIHTAIQHWEAIHLVKPDFKDVAEKLKSYEEFRVDDVLKDFMIATPARFEDLSSKLVASMGFTVVEMELVNDAALDILATESEGKFRHMKRNNQLIKIRRVTDTIPVSQVEKLFEEMKSKNANLGVFITTGEFSTAAQEFVKSRPVNLIGRAGLSSLFQKI